MRDKLSDQRHLRLLTDLHRHDLVGKTVQTAKRHVRRGRVRDAILGLSRKRIGVPDPTTSAAELACVRECERERARGARIDIRPKQHLLWHSARGRAIIGARCAVGIEVG